MVIFMIIIVKRVKNVILINKVVLIKNKMLRVN